MPRRLLLLFTVLVVSYAHRLPAVTFLVTTNADNGPGSLRQAILDANATPGPDFIHFSIGTGPQTIQPLSPMPIITDTVSVNGATQPGYTNVPMIELDGSAIVANSAGLTLGCSGTAVSGLIINRFPGAGIWIFGQGRNFIAANYLGTDRSGKIAFPNQSGIVITSSVANQIGLNDVASRNIISGNDTYGIVLSVCSSNVIEGNYIGTDAEGTSAVPNALDGIFFENFADFNTVGGSSVGAGNLISGNRGNGIRSALSFSNVIEGNRVGTDASGTSAIPNQLCGINGGINYTIGGNTPSARNVISGNAVHGIEIYEDNVIQGNLIGTDGGGSSALGNGVAGIFVGGDGVLIGGTERDAGNVISGNGDYGIWLLSSSNSIVQGNLIGTDRTGAAALQNGEHGMLLTESPDNLIGGFEAGAGNVISGNNNQGIRLTGSNSRNNIIAGNYVGTDITGSAPIPNVGGGVQLNGAPENSVQSNVLSGNNGPGLDLLSSNCVVIANLIGTDTSGRARLPNQGSGIRIFSRANTIGGTEPESRNIISGNAGAGIQVGGASAVGNVIQGNYVGINVAGTAAVPNSLCGIQLTGAATATTVGGSEPGAANIISGNGGVEPLLSAGIIITGPGTTNNVVHGNLIGTDASGRFRVPNQQAGVRIAGANRNHIGGTTSGEGNLIAFNGEGGVVIEFEGAGNAIIGNSIHSNGELGIDLGGDGVTSNDVGDGDTGPNGLQNYPVITNIVYLSNNTIIQGYLRSSTNGSFSIDVYANVATEQRGYGEGQFYLGNVDVDTDENGFTEFAFSAGNTFSNQFFTATALNYDTADTSEFSAAMGGIRITAIERIASQYRVSFSTITNRTYVLQFATNLNSSMSWSPVVLPPQPIQGTGGIVTVSDTAPSTDSVRIYRVFQQP
jgi:titin